MAKSPSSKRPPAPSSGAPRWTYALVAIVGAAGLIWTIVSTFIPKAEPAKPARAASSVPEPAGAASVSVSGSGSVSVGTMSGGSINVGGPAPQANTGSAASGVK